MLPIFLWIFVILNALPVFSEQIGTLNVNIFYHNANGVNGEGEKCDPILNPLCDVYFQICVDERGSSPKCSVYNKKSEIARNAVIVSYDFKVPYSTNNQLVFRITAFDHDHLSEADLLGKFEFLVSPSEGPTILPIVSNHAHATTELRLTASRNCTPNHYGNTCRFCQVPKKRGYCDKEGNFVCYPGYFDPQCMSVVGCYNMTCASFASCQRVKESAEDDVFACFCDDTFGEMCEEGYDPCEKHQCLHNGTCVPTGTHMNFAKCVNCTERWVGEHCEKELDVCGYEEYKLGHSPCLNGGHCVVNPLVETDFACLCAPGWLGSRCERFSPTSRSRSSGNICDEETARLGHSPCENDGHCVVDPANETIFTCLCAPGWQGPRCEVSFTKASAVVTVVSIILLILIICLIIGVICCIRIFAVPKLRQVLKKRNGIEMAQMDGSVLAKANSLYNLTESHDNLHSPPYPTIWKRSGDTTFATNPLQPDVSEYEAMLDPNPVKSFSMDGVPEVSAQDVEDYEPVNDKHQNIVESKAMSTAKWYCGTVRSSTTLKRPLPSTPENGEDHGFLCNGGSRKDPAC